MINRRKFVGTALAGLGGLGGLFIPQKAEALPSDDITQYDLGTDHIVVRHEVLTKFLRSYSHNPSGSPCEACVSLHDFGVSSDPDFMVPMWKPNQLAGSIQKEYESFVKFGSSGNCKCKYVYIFHNSERNLWGFFGCDDRI